MLGAIDAALPIKVYSEYYQVVDNLNDPTRYVFVKDPAEATILWTSLSYIDIVQFKEINTFYNCQFNFEAALVTKNHLANLIRTTLSPEDQHIIPESFVLDESLPAFVGRYLEK